MQHSKSKDARTAKGGVHRSHVRKGAVHVRDCSSAHPHTSVVLHLESMHLDILLGDALFDAAY